MPFTLTMPKLSPTMEAGTIAKWHVKEGDFVEVDQLIMEVATDKATVEYNAIDEGFFKKILIQEGADAVVNQPLAILTEDRDESIEGYIPEGIAQENSSVEKEEIPVIKEVERREDKSVFASPLARVMAKQQGMDLSQVEGTGPRGRVMRRDLDSFEISKLETTNIESLKPAGAFHEETMSQLRKVIATRLQISKQTVPHFYLKQDVDVSSLLELREQLKSDDVKLTVNDFIVKAVALALEEYKEVNSGFNEECGTIIRFDTIDISIAVDIEGGLITPIVTNANTKLITEISKEVKQLAKKAREGKLQPHEFQGGSFTLSNLGMFGTDEFSAIINTPQAAILAVGAAKEKVIAVDGMIEIAQMLTLTLSVDHRVIDGSHAAKFAKSLKEKLEKPALLLL